jgi:hypothetical protein
LARTGGLVGLGIFAISITDLQAQWGPIWGFGFSRWAGRKAHLAADERRGTRVTLSCRDPGGSSGVAGISTFYVAHNRGVLQTEKSTSRSTSSRTAETYISHTSPHEISPTHNPNPLNNLPPIRRPRHSPASRSRTTPRAIVELGSPKWNHRSAAPAQGAPKKPLPHRVEIGFAIFASISNQATYWLRS